MNAVNGFYRENGREEVGTEHETYAASEGFFGGVRRSGARASIFHIFW